MQRYSLHHAYCSSWGNLSTLIACTFWGSYGWSRTEAWLTPMSQIYLPDVHSKLYLVASKLGTWGFPSAKMWLFLLRLSTELWMGSVAVKCSVAVYTMRIAAAEEICRHLSPAFSEGQTDGAVRKHGPHSRHAKPYGCLRMVIPQDDRECHPQTTLSRQVVWVQGRAFFIATFPSTIITEERGVMRQMSSWLWQRRRDSLLLFLALTASEVRVSQSRPNATMYNYYSQSRTHNKWTKCCAKACAMLIRVGEGGVSMITDKLLVRLQLDAVSKQGVFGQNFLN
jgi:hypothetical protein